MSSSSVTLTGSSPTSVSVSVTTLGTAVRRSVASNASRLGGRKALYLSLCGFPGLIVLGFEAQVGTVEIRWTMWLRDPIEI